MRAIPWAALVAVLAAAQLEAEQRRFVVWQSEGPTSTDIAKDLTKLYLGLHSEGLLRTRDIQDPEGRPVLQILEDEHLWFGGGYPPELDRLLCRLNRRVCSLGPDKNTDDGGNAVHWTNQKDSIIAIPDLHFELYTAPRPYKKSANEDLATAVVKIRRGCVEYNEECQRVIRNVNSRSGYELEAKYAGEILLPTLSVRTLIDRAPDLPAEDRKQIRDHRIGGKPVDTGQKTPSQGEPTPESAGEEATRIEGGVPDDAEGLAAEEEFFEEAHHALEGVSLAGASRRTASEASDPDAAVAGEAAGEGSRPPLEQYAVPDDTIEAEARALKDRRLLKNVPARVKPEAESFPDEPTSPSSCAQLEADHKGLFALIQLPGSVSCTFPVTVGVIDGWTDAKHCEFRGLEIDAHNNSGREVDRADCEKCEVGTFIKPNDHGTHVAAIVGATVRGTDGEPGGRLPSIMTLEASDSDPMYSFKASELIRLGMEWRIDIFNLSSSYRVTTEGDDPLKARMSDYTRNKLFVVAAGNTKTNLSVGCSVFPACFNLPNVLNVIALDRDPVAPSPLEADGSSSGSNYGLTTHLGAPGDKVLSAVHGDRYGLASGTSQATPIVSAAAALLLASDDSLSPQQLKERLIYTCDLPKSLRGKVVGGRLNVTRALNFKEDVLTVETGGTLKEARGKTSYDILYYREFDDDASMEKRSVAWSDVLRLYRAPDERTHTLLIRGENGVPKRLDGVRVFPTSNIPLLLRADDAELEVQPSEIRDYVARIRSTGD
jgi:hypothetical protein